MKRDTTGGGTHHCPSPPSFSPCCGLSGSSLDCGVLEPSVTTGTAQSDAVSTATGKTSTGGAVESGELHSTFEPPLRRASRCRFLYSSRDTWEGAEGERYNHTNVHGVGVSVSARDGAQDLTFFFWGGF